MSVNAFDISDNAKLVYDGDSLIVAHAFQINGKDYDVKIEKSDVNLGLTSLAVWESSGLIERVQAVWEEVADRLGTDSFEVARLTYKEKKTTFETGSEIKNLVSSNKINVNDLLGDAKLKIFAKREGQMLEGDVDVDSVFEAEYSPKGVFTLHQITRYFADKLKLQYLHELRKKDSASQSQSGFSSTASLSGNGGSFASTSNSSNKIQIPTVIVPSVTVSPKVKKPHSDSYFSWLPNIPSFLKKHKPELNPDSPSITQEMATETSNPLVLNPNEPSSITTPTQQEEDLIIYNGDDPYLIDAVTASNLLSRLSRIN